MSDQDWFGTVTADVAFDPTITSTSKAVYLVLVMYRNRDTNACFPSNETVAKAIGSSERTVIRALGELVEKGVIRREARFDDGRQTTSITYLTDARATRRGVHR